MSFGVINLLLFFFLSSVIKNNTLNMILLVFAVIDIWRWWKRIVKHAELVQRSVDPEANIIFGTVTDESMGDEIQITVIATGFEKNEPISSIGVDNIVSKTWEKKVNSIPASSEASSSQNDLDIPAFLRKNRNKN